MNEESAQSGPPFGGDAGLLQTSPPGQSAPATTAGSPGATAPQTTANLIDMVIHATAEHPDDGDDQRRDQFLRASTVRQALECLFGAVPQMPEDRLVRFLNAAVAHIDGALNDQLNTILHAPSFQRLEASWRGLQFLVDRADYEDDPSIKIRVLNVTWRELEKDFEKTSEFDQSQLFKKVYEQEFGTPGGEPYGVLIADYEIHPRPHADYPHDDITILESLSRVAAAAFCPVIANVNPAMFGLDGFEGLEHTVDHSRTFDQTTFLKWRALRDKDDSRFVGLALPRVLMRLPYEDDGRRVDEFRFREDVRGVNYDKYLWGGAAFAMGEVLMRAFAQAGWLADIRGVRRGEERGGLVTGLPVHSFSTDKMGVATKCSTDVIVTDELEKQLSELGFIPLCHCKDTDYSAFYSNQSIQKPKRYDRAVATVNARISSMVQYMLCVSRFAHYVKVLGREKSGSFTEAHELESYLQNWIVKYVTADSEARTDVKARRPLREAKIGVRSVPGKPGSFRCTMHLAPHYELDELSASVKLAAELTPASKS